ncbi:Lactosylceramide 4-alpha-galactosyltransferase (Fragment) [Geodia barretti]|uniref:Lactosylceramide 4-alpha-galactosyltransferase n=1 Tax=Geodia barretti TaxID=519541 RepID=A0AA35SFH3_GEOBA
MKRTRVVVAAVPLVVFAAVSFLAYGLSVSFRLPTPFNENCVNWLKSCEENCVQNSTTPIPKHVHFVSLNHPFSFMEWLAVVSARNKIKPDKITVYTDGLQDSCWWRRALPYIDHQIIHTLPGANVLNRVPIKLLPHKSDFLRLSILYHSGGIYMDTDILSLNSFDPLLKHQMVLAEQCHYALNVALMMAQKHSCLVCRFAHYSCERFNGGWVHHSVDALSSFIRGLDKEKEGVLVVPWKKGFFPMCWNANGINQLYKKHFNDIPDYNRSEIYSVHLYNNKAKNLIPKTLHNFDWIQTSTSLVGLTIRESLPPGFSKHHLNESSRCTDIQLPD